MAKVGMNTTAKLDKATAKELKSLLMSKRDTLVIGGAGSGKFQTATATSIKTALNKGTIKGNLLHALLKGIGCQVQDNSSEGLCQAVNNLK